MSHVHFVGIGGAGIGPLAQVAYQAGLVVSGSDLKQSEYIEYLKRHGIENIEIGESKQALTKINASSPIDWLVYTSALTVNDPSPKVLETAKKLGIRVTKRDTFINQILEDHNLRLIAIAGTHGKTTTTAMVIWLFKELGINISYTLPAKITFGQMGQFNKDSEYFVYEADEFDRNFLSFNPEISLITGVSWDHHEIYSTRDEYSQAFIQFINQSQQSYLWKTDKNTLAIDYKNVTVLNEDDPLISRIKLDGLFNRRDAHLTISAVSKITGKDINELTSVISKFPGLGRRMEEITTNLYSDYAHTPDKIKAAMNVAADITKRTGQKIIILYEPLTNRRQTYIKDEYKNCFDGADKIYWLDSYLAREDPNTNIITPNELIQNLSNPSIAQPAKLNEELKNTVSSHLNSGDLVIGMTGGGVSSLDDWLRDNFSS